MDCWEWDKGRNSAGYGQVYLDGKMQRVHRISYEEWKTQMRDLNKIRWRPIGDWLLPTSECHYKGVFFHTCKEEWLMDTESNWIMGANLGVFKNKCPSCGADVPDGIKMISRLLSW